MPESTGGRQNKQRAFLVSIAGQRRKKLGMELTEQKSVIAPLLGFTWFFPLNVSLNYSWFGLVMLSSNFYVTFPLLTPMAKSTLWGRPGLLCPSLGKPGAWQGSTPEACSMDDGN